MEPPHRRVKSFVSSAPSLRESANPPRENQPKRGSSGVESGRTVGSQTKFGINLGSQPSRYVASQLDMLSATARYIA